MDDHSPVEGEARDGADTTEEYAHSSLLRWLACLTALYLGEEISGGTY
jgi:hypothetical protein